ncbi:MAG: dihydrofolate reductase family protein [Propionibacteriaceae bacterium]|nr:dihydrofolate reductase family protein [Propionibacteriaceae bacterium]
MGERPKVVMYQVATADGRVALSPEILVMNDDRWPRYTDGGYALVQQYHHPQVFLEGSGTFVLPDAEPLAPKIAQDLEPVTNPHEHYLPRDVLDSTTRWLAIIDSRGRVAWEYTTFPGEQWEGVHLLVVVSRATPSHYLSFLQAKNIPYLVVGEEKVDLRLMLHTMGEVFGVRTVAATCGAQLGGALLRAGLVDELDIEVMPILAGGGGRTSMMVCDGLGSDKPPTRLSLLEATNRDDGRVLLRYQVLGDHP